MNTVARMPAAGRAELLQNTGAQMDLDPNTVEFVYPLAGLERVTYARPRNFLELGTHAELVPSDLYIDRSRGRIRGQGQQATRTPSPSAFTKRGMEQADLG